LLARGLTHRLLSQHEDSLVQVLVAPEALEAFDAFVATLPPANAARVVRRVGRAFDTDLGLTGADAAWWTWWTIFWSFLAAALPIWIWQLRLQYLKTKDLLGFTLRRNRADDGE
jgi:hypothetical protein